MQRSARERFNDLIDPMINIAHKMVEEAEAGSLSASDRLGLMKFIADRTGFVPGKVVNVDGPPRWEGVMTHIITNLPEGDVIDAEVVEEDEEARYEREKRRQREIEEQARREQQRDLARAELPQIVPAANRDERATIRRGTPDPPQHPGYRR